MTTRRPECLIAASPAASSASRSTVPPWMNPAEFASAIPIQRTSSDSDREAGRSAISSAGPDSGWGRSGGLISSATA